MVRGAGGGDIARMDHAESFVHPLPSGGPVHRLDSTRNLGATGPPQTAHVQHMPFLVKFMRLYGSIGQRGRPAYPALTIGCSQ